MCKIFAIAGIKPSKKAKAWELIEAMAKPMSKFNSDGLGYGAITKDGELFGERWLTNSQAFQREETADVVSEMLGDAIEKKNTVVAYSSYGELDFDNAVAVTLHTRMATSAKGLMNVHPFTRDGVSLIHNGVIRNVHDFELELSTCDSESILISYLNKAVLTENDWQPAADLLKGYYACGVLAKAASGPILDILKSNARLSITYVKELETVVTSTDDDDIRNVCKDLGLTIGPVYSIKQGYHLRFDAVTGKEISVKSFLPSVESTYSPPTYASNNWAPAKPAESKAAAVLPYKKKNTPLAAGMLDYFKAGTKQCVRLSEREIQELIMEQERTGSLQ